MAENKGLGAHLGGHLRENGMLVALVAIVALFSILLGAQGKPMDIGGYYLPDFGKASGAMRPSATLNAIIDSL